MIKGTVYSNILKYLRVIPLDSHGKGPTDGIGGEVKRISRLSVPSGKSRVQNAQEFIKVIREKIDKV